MFRLDAHRERFQGEGKVDSGPVQAHVVVQAQVAGHRVLVGIQGGGAVGIGCGQDGEKVGAALVRVHGKVGVVVQGIQDQSAMVTLAKGKVVDVVVKVYPFFGFLNGGGKVARQQAHDGHDEESAVGLWYGQITL